MLINVFVFILLHGEKKFFQEITQDPTTVFILMCFFSLRIPLFLCCTFSNEVLCIPHASMHYTTEPSPDPFLYISMHSNLIQS